MWSLGIGYGLHDSTAALARDGEVVFAMAEERVSRRKHDACFPFGAIEACFRHAGITAQDLDYVCFGWPGPLRSVADNVGGFLRRRAAPDSRYARFLARYLVRHTLEEGGMRPFVERFGAVRAKPLFCEHHLAHAISAYAFSGYGDATVLVVDGQGTREATSIWRASGGRLENVRTIEWPCSLGLLYAEVTHHLGFEKFSDEWKVMGLAPYGRPGVDLTDLVRPDEDPYWVNGEALLRAHRRDSILAKRFGERRKPESEILPQHEDLAYAVQDACERAVLSVVRDAVARTGLRDVCMAGGVALNSKANGRVLASGLVDRLFVQPAASDEGISLGAALYPYLAEGGRLPSRAMRHAYLGSAADDAEIARCVSTYKLRATRETDVAKATAQLLADGKVVGWFQGRMEFGPRALGARSILADPRRAEMKDRVNDAVKFRENWRPFAPATLKKSAPEFFEGCDDAPFMIVCYPVKEDRRDAIPAVTHKDGSARVQTVDEEQNAPYARMIDALGGITGVPVVMNTSFNLRGEPIVCTPTDAIRTFFSSGMDALVLHDHVVVK